MPKHVLLVVAFLVMASCAWSAYWTPSNTGMQAWSFTDIVVNPSNPQIIYAVGMSGVYKSTNGGSSWASASSGLAASPYSHDIEMHPNDPNTLYVVSQFQEGGRGIYKSTDAGATWVRKSNGIYLPYINSVTIFKANPQVLFCGTNVGGAKGGVFKSTDGAESWTLIAGDDFPGSGIGNDAAPIVVDPADSNYVYCGRNSYTGFLRSTDGGSHWTWQDNTFVITDLLIHPADTNRILAGGRGFLKISRNRGQSLVSVGLDQTVGAIAVDPSNTDVIYAGTFGAQVYRSADRGDTWAPVGSEPHQFAALAVHPTNSNTLYAATSGEGILKSTNGGVTWSGINAGLPSQMRCTKMVSSLRYRTIWAIIDTRALYASYDDGATWNQLAAISGYPTDLELWAGDGKTLFMANGDIYKSTDLGFTWTPLTIVPGHTFTQIGVDPTNPNRVFVFDSADNKIRRTTDGGTTWEAVATITAFMPHWGNVGVSDVVVDPSNPQRIYLGTMNHPWKSEDGGDTWTILTGLEYTVIYNGKSTPTSFIRDIAIDPVQPNVVYATTQWGWSWKSNDHGNTWNRLTDFPFDANVHNNVIFDPREHNTLYIASTNFGVFKSTNGGQSFTQLIDGLSGADTNIYVVALSPWNYDHILGGSYNQGVYRGGGPHHVPTLAEAKGLIPDGGVFSFTQPLVVSGVMTDGAVYIQTEDRSQGIRVLEASGLNPGDLVEVKGVMGTESGERCMSALDVKLSGTTGIPEPLGMTNLAVGGASHGPEQPQIPGSAGASNTGLLISSWGRVTSIVDANRFYIDDGSGIGDGIGTGVCVETPSTALLEPGDWVSVTGASGVTMAGSTPARLIRARSQDDLMTGVPLINPGFETGDMTGWTYIEQAGAVRLGPVLGGIVGNTGDYFWGHYTSSTPVPASFYQAIQVEPGRIYRARTYSRIYRGANTVEDVKSRVGIDPTGGTDTNSPNVVWSPWDTQPAQYFSEWHSISTPSVAASGGTVTVFLEAHQSGASIHINCFDDISLLWGN